MSLSVKTRAAFLEESLTEDAGADAAEGELKRVGTRTGHRPGHH